VSVLIVGISHKTAPVALLERLALDRDGLVKLITDVRHSSHVGEATVIATCNRLEVYAEVDRFHGSVEELSSLLVERSGEPTDALLPHLYVHYDEAAVAHLFQVTAGLDSMVVGEAQILGQTREALRVGQELGTAGAALNTLFQQALRVGKRVHAETDLDRAAPSLVTAALEHASPDGAAITGKRVVILGAGSMAGVATATVSRLGAGDIVISNRTVGNADRLAADYAARSVPFDALDDELARADVLIACTGALGHVISRDQLAPALADGRSFLAIDLAMPHDIDPTVADLPGVRLVGLASLAETLEDDDDLPYDLEDVRSIVGDEVAAFMTARRVASVTPTVVALRTMATSVVEAEAARLDNRLPDLDPKVRAEVVATLRRVSEKLLHQPTVRVRELEAEGEAVSYAAALAELFALDPEAVQAVTRVEGL
jgi:glutamyl-tRNA reductase